MGEGRYKGYSGESAKKSTIKYIKEKQRQVIVRWKKEDYEEHIGPAIKRSGKPMSQFIKEAVNEKIEREGL